jgi:hypothetical protein
MVGGEIASHNLLSPQVPVPLWLASLPSSARPAPDRPRPAAMDPRPDGRGGAADYRGATGLTRGIFQVSARHLPYHREGERVDRVLVLLQDSTGMA